MAPALRLAKGVADGVLDVCRPGVTLGWAGEDPIVGTGQLMIGTHRYVLGVTPGARVLYLLSGRKLWGLQGRLVRPAPPVPHELEPLRLWADMLARACCEQLTSPAEQRVVELSLRRYHATVRACVETRMLEAAEYGEVRSYDDYARAICVLWEKDDLLSPRIVTLHHAMQVCLVLALPVARAAKLLEFAGFLEHRAHLLDRGTCHRMYERASGTLALLCPAWQAQGHLTDWRQLGDMERIWRGQYARLIREAAARDLSMEALLQMGAANLVAELLGTDTAHTYDAWRATAGSAADARFVKEPDHETMTVEGDD